MEEVTLKMSKLEAIAVWHYFNAGRNSQQAFDKKYPSGCMWTAEKFKYGKGGRGAYPCWYNISNQLRELGIDPHEDFKPKPETMIEVEGKKWSESTIKEALKQYVT